MANFLDGLVLYLQGEESSGNLNDDSTNGNDAQPSGTVEYSVAGKIGVSPRLNFGGGVDHFFIPNTSDLLFTGSFTVACWVNIFNEAGGSGQVFGCWFGTTERSFVVLYSQSPNTYLGAVSHDGSQANTVSVQSSIAPVAFDTWYHIVFICDVDANLLTFYLTPDTLSSVNTADTTAFTEAGMWTGNTNQLQYGRLETAGPGYIHGRIDELGMWNRAWTSADVDAHFNGGSGLAFSGFTSEAGDAGPSYFFFYDVSGAA